MKYRLFCGIGGMILQRLISYLRSKYLYIYILTLPFAYANAIFPAAIQASGGWIVEHTPALRVVAVIILSAVVGYFALAKLAVYNQKVLSACVYTAGQNLRQDLMETMLKDRETEVSSSVQLNDVVKIEENLFLGFIELAEQVVFYILVFVIICVQNPLVAVFMALASLLTAAISKSSMIRGMALQEGVSKKQEEMLEFLEHTQQGNEAIRIYGLHKRMEQAFKKLSQKLNHLLGKLLWQQDKIGVITFAFLLAAATGGILLSNAFILRGTLTITQLLVMIQLSNNLFKPIGKIVNCGFKVKSVKAVTEKLNRILERKNDMVPVDNAQAVTKQLKHSLKVDVDKFGLGGRVLLRDIHLDILPGEKILIAGTNGCGKSTLLKNILGKYGYTQGAVSLDGEDAFLCSENDVQACFAPVSQEVYLFQGTVAENISCFGRYSQAAVGNALKRTHLETINVQSDALALSGGQKQRIAIARALASGRNILVLDEAFSAVDRTMNDRIERNLLMDKALTVLAIAHRLCPENYELYDRIVLMKDGTIEKTGCPKAMLGERFVQDLLTAREDVV